MATHGGAVGVALPARELDAADLFREVRVRLNAALAAETDPEPGSP